MHSGNEAELYEKEFRLEYQEDPDSTCCLLCHRVYPDYVSSVYLNRKTG